MDKQHACEGNFPYIHRNDPITRTRPCDDCGGKGTWMDRPDKTRFPHDVAHAKKCPTCKDGVITEELIESIANCGECGRFQEEYPSCSTNCGTPVTPSNIGEFDEFEWRKV